MHKLFCEVYDYLGHLLVPKIFVATCGPFYMLCIYMNFEIRKCNSELPLFFAKNVQPLYFMEPTS